MAPRCAWLFAVSASMLATMTASIAVGRQEASAMAFPTASSARSRRLLPQSSPNFVWLAPMRKMSRCNAEVFYASFLL